MVILKVGFAFVLYFLVRLILIKYTKIELDLIPDRYYDNPIRTWRNAGVFLICFIISWIAIEGLIL